jgi:hypothetical protein
LKRSEKKSNNTNGLLAPFSSISYGGKILLGLIFIAASAITLMLFISKLNDQHGGFADFVRLLAWGVCGGIALLGMWFLRWAFVERR